MTIHQLLLVGGKLVELFDASYYDVSLSPADSFAGVQYNSDGNIYKCEGNFLSYVDTGDDWLIAGSAGDYYIRCDYSGDAPNGGSTTGVWHQLSTTRSWSVGITGLGSLASTLTIRIASDSGGTNVLDTCTVNIEANVEP